MQFSIQRLHLPTCPRLQDGSARSCHHQYYWHLEDCQEASFVCQMRRITSSFIAMMHFDNPPKSYSESEWNPMTIEEAAPGYSVFTYRGSKALADRAA